MDFEKAAGNTIYGCILLCPWLPTQMVFFCGCLFSSLHNSHKCLNGKQKCSTYTLHSPTSTSTSPPYNQGPQLQANLKGANVKRFLLSLAMLNILSK